MTEQRQPAGFLHLHLHSEYSLLDGGNRIPKLVERIRALGMDAVALTDHGNLFGAIEFYAACRSAGVKPILGVEAYVAPDIHTETSDRRHKEAQGVADGGFHLVLLAENEAGWRNLLKLSSDSFVEGFYYRPRMDKGTLETWNQGLIAINGHLGSSIAYHLDQYEKSGREVHYQRARTEALWHAQVFGPNERGEPRFFLELQRHDTPEQDAVNTHVLRLASELGLPLVCDNDSHFLLAEDWDAHDTLVCVSTGKLKSDERRLHYPKELYVKGPEQMTELFSDVPEALTNTRAIADRCNVELDFSANHAPLVGVRRRPPDDSAGPEDAPRGSNEWFKRQCSTFELVPVEGEAPSHQAVDAEERERKRSERERKCDEALRELAELGLVWRYGDEGITDEHRARLERELQVLADKKISAYFLIVWDFVSEARRRGIPAMARGSGVGTMVGYVLGLSNACPVRYGLLFERFTDPDRSEYPDIDIDLCQDGRGEILDYVREKYGYVAQIITFGTMKARAAVRDVGRVLDLPLPDVDRICKLIGSQLGTTLADALDREPELDTMCREDPQVRSVIDTARKLEGMVRHSGVHAAGVVIATEPLENLVPLALAKPGDRSNKDKGRNGKNGDRAVLVTQWDGPTVEKMGLLKMDFLGLKTLSVLERAKTLVRETIDDATVRETITERNPDGKPPGRDALDLDRIDFSDPNVLALYQRGESIGTFQFESDGMRNLLLKMRPDRLEDLVAANALFRPGPMALIDDYCARKHGRQEVPQVHEIVDRFTADTYGIMVYQEQVMQIAHELGGIPLREAYSLIKAISKKKHDVINAARTRFLEGAAAQGLERRRAETLFELILRFAGYGFNKSHSVGYSILAFQTAFLKTYFPVQYMAAVLTYESDHLDKLAVYLDECKRVRLHDGSRGVAVNPPDVNRSRVRFQVVFDQGEAHTASNGHIRFGLSAVRGVGAKAVEAILETRDADGPFSSLFDFCARVPQGLVNRTTIDALIRAGAFDSIHGSSSRAALVEALEGAIRYGQRVAADRESGQSNLFASGESGAQEAIEPQLPEVTPWSTKEQLREEKAALGFYVSRHPLDEHQGLLERFSNTSIAGIAELDEHYDVVVGAMISRMQVRRTKRGQAAGERMASLTLEDRSGKIEAVAFPEVFARLENQLEEDAILFFKAKVDRRREEPSLVLAAVVRAEDASAKLTRRVRIRVEHRTAHAEERSGSPEQSEFELRDELMKLRELLERERRGVNGSSAEVEFEIHTEDAVVRTAATGLRVPVHDRLVRRIEKALGQSDCCELLGPAPPHHAPPEPRRWGPGGGK